MIYSKLEKREERNEVKGKLEERGKRVDSKLEKREERKYE
jgi:hypothetical protein